jgi:V/A-type H+-transporting ATPase subunit I
VFGSVFCIEGVFEPLWVSPLEKPLEVLLVPIVFGMMLLFTGIFLEALSYVRIEALSEWLVQRVPVIMVYLGAALFLITQSLESLWITIFGAILFQLIVCHFDLQRFFLVLSEAVEQLFQLGLNTVSFLRVGAFALAHAGISSVVASLAHATDSVVAAMLVLVFGNIFVLVLEGLVVSIQTTRLILLEFFLRFAKGSGRPFTPLTLPQLSC